MIFVVVVVVVVLVVLCWFHVDAMLSVVILFWNVVQNQGFNLHQALQTIILHTCVVVVSTLLLEKTYLAT